MIDLPERDPDLFTHDPDVEKAKKAAFQLLERRSYTRSEIVGKLEGRGYGGKTVATTVETLERIGLIDDADFATRFVRERMRLRPCGHVALRRDLRRRGVESEVIEAVLETSFEGVDLEAVAFDLLCQRRSRYLHLDRPKALNRMYGFLGRRGFSPDVARSAATRAYDAVAEEQASRGDAQP